VPKPVLTLILAHADLAVQAGHLARGALFVPEPEPLPEPFVEIVLRVETPSRESVEIDGKVIHILPGHGIAIAFDDLPGAKTKLAPLFAEPPPADGAGDGATLLFWGRTERLVTAPPAAAPATPADPAAPPEDADLELDATVKLEAEIAAMNTNQKMQLAMRGDRTARTLLFKDLNKNLQGFVVQNPRITLDEVRSIAANRLANPEVLNTIAAHKDWGGNPNIVVALVRNPKTPATTAARLIDKVPIAEVRRLAKATDVPRAVTAAARKRVADTGAP
jgi:hypothetical protein